MTFLSRYVDVRGTAGHGITSVCSLRETALESWFKSVELNPLGGQYLRQSSLCRSQLLEGLLAEALQLPMLSDFQLQLRQLSADLVGDRLVRPDVSNALAPGRLVPKTQFETRPPARQWFSRNDPLGRKALVVAVRQAQGAQARKPVPRGNASIV